MRSPITSRPAVLAALAALILASGNTPLTARNGRVLTVMSGSASIEAAAYTSSSRKVRERELAAKRRRIDAVADRTYLHEILAQHDSSLARWPGSVERSVRVWISPARNLDNFRPELESEVQAAFAEWQNAGLPFRFGFVRDSLDADVTVGWVEQFEEPISGSTTWARDQHWWIAQGRITLALHNQTGERLSNVAIRALTLHEIGHLIGLDHTSDSTSIMSPRVRVKTLSDPDRSTMLMLYSLPPGSIR